MPKQQRSYRTEALILKRRDFGEADRLLTLLTPTNGRVDAIAKGARKPNTTKTGHVELFTKADMLINRGRELDIVTQVVMVEPYLPLREDLQRGAFANYIAELMIRFTGENDEDDTQQFELLENTFQRLCETDDLRLAVRYYEMRLLDLTGFRPELQYCVISQEEIQPENQFFSYEQGGIVSPSQAHLLPNLVPVSLNALKVIRHLQRSSYEQVASLTIPNTIHNDIERIMQGYLTHILERRLQSVDFIRRVGS